MNSEPSLDPATQVFLGSLVADAIATTVVGVKVPNACS